MTAKITWFRREAKESTPDYQFAWEDLELVKAAIEARKPDPNAMKRLRAIHQFYDIERDENDRLH